MKQITGWHVFGLMALGFGTIIAVNLTLAFNAVRTFPGLETRNSYVASQHFDSNRTAQEALGWEVSAILQGDELRLTVLSADGPVAPRIERAVFGRATSVAADQTPEFTFDGTAHVAQVEAGPGNWNLRLQARADNGVLFQQRIVVRVRR